MTEAAATVETGTTNVETDQGTNQNSSVPSYAGTKHKVKFDGQEFDVAYEDLVSDYQQKRVSQKRFEEAAGMKKTIDTFIGQLKNGDFSALKEIMPPDQLRKFAEKELRDFIEYSELSQDARDKIEAQRERDAYKKKNEAFENEMKRRQSLVLEQRAMAELDTEMKEALIELKAAQGMSADTPVEPWMIDKIAAFMLADLENAEDENAPRLPAKKATQMAWSMVESTVSNYLKSIPTAKLVELLPKEARDAIRKSDMAQVQSPFRQGKKIEGNQPKPSAKRQKVDLNDFFSNLEKKFN